MKKVRPAEMADLEGVMKLVHHLAVVELRPDAVTIDVEGLKHLIFRPDSPAKCLIAEDSSGNMLGYALTARKFSSFKGFDTIYLEDLVLSPDLQGAGLGRQFMKLLASWCLEQGAKRLEWSAETVNEKAVAFYDRLGAERETGRVHFTFEEEALSAFSKNLNT